MSKNIVLLGAQGCGKGTQAKIICEKYSIPHISTGDIFRQNIRDGTELGVLAKSYIDKGNLVPDDVTNNMVKNRLLMSDCQNGFVLDGFPRTLDQGKALDSMTSINFVINLVISEETTIMRLSGRRSCKNGHVYHVTLNPPKVADVCDVDGEELFQRDDDKKEAIKKRLEEYHTKTEPLTSFYKEKGVLCDVDGEQALEKVSKDIFGCLESTS
ncbi:adenylate kinase [Candidatus Woesearchaeota archaeon]|nr:adenylate kinase [Candidatus Woesearchaeota archaeon]